MKFRYIGLVFTGFISLLSANLHPFVEKMVTLRGKHGQLITLLGTRHSDYPDRELTNQQRAEIALAAHKYGAAVVCEDVWDYQGAHEVIKKEVASQAHQQGENCAGRTITIKGSPKGERPMTINIDCCFGLTAHCTKSAIPVYNAECRHYSTASRSDKKSLITGAMALESFTTVIHEMLEYYDDTFYLNYPLLISRFLQDNAWYLSHLRLATFPESVLLSKLIHSPHYHKRADFRKIMFGIGDELVECRMLHGISSFKDHKHIFVCCGAQHVDVVEKILNESAYTTLLQQTHLFVERGTSNIIDPINIPAYFAQLDEQLAKESSASTTSSTSTEKPVFATTLATFSPKFSATPGLREKKA